MRTFQLIPGIAAYLGVRELPGDIVQSAIFLSNEKGVVVGLHDKPMAQSGWPLKVQAAVNKHFGIVFALEHETWRQRGPSPRAHYCDNLEPWTVEVDE